MACWFGEGMGATSATLVRRTRLARKGRRERCGRRAQQVPRVGVAKSVLSAIEVEEALRVQRAEQ
jgi:hypothetical protein